MRLDEPVRERAAQYLTELDERAPGLAEGVYFWGSVALGDYRPGRSDLDLLVATSRPVGTDEVAMLARVHAALPAGPHCDAIYLDWPSVRAMVDDQRAVPFVVDGQFHNDRSCGSLTPVLWTTLARHGITLRGPGIADLELHPDPQRLRRYNEENLASYWAPLSGQIRAALADGPTELPFGQDIVPWLVLGAARLHYTIATGQIASESAIGGYVAERFPEWGPLADRCVRWRHGEHVARFAPADAVAAADLTDAVTSAAN